MLFDPQQRFVVSPARRATTAVSRSCVCSRDHTLPVSVLTFESVSGARTTAVVLLVYRPGSAAVNAQFTDLESVLEVVALYKCQLLVAGDFTIGVDRNDDRNITALQDIFSSFDCVQHRPHQPTHRNGGTLDLVITKSEQTLDALVVDPPDSLSNHSLIRWSLRLHYQPPVTITRDVRS